MLHSRFDRKAQYERNFNNWGWRRKLKAVEWRAIERQLEKRKTDGKAESDLHIQGVYMPRKKIQRGVARHRFQTTLEVIEQSKCPEFCTCYYETTIGYLHKKLHLGLAIILTKYGSPIL